MIILSSEIVETISVQTVTIETIGISVDNWVSVALVCDLTVTIDGHFANSGVDSLTWIVDLSQSHRDEGHQSQSDLQLKVKLIKEFDPSQDLPEFCSSCKFRFVLVFKLNSIWFLSKTFSLYIRFVTLCI